MKKCSWTSLISLFATLLFLKFAYECFMFWSDLLTVPGALIFGTVCLGLIVRLGIQVICFPKSFFFFKRDTELELMTVVSSRWIALLGVVADVLSDQERNSLGPMEVKILREVKTKVELALKTYSLMLHKHQFNASHQPLHQLFSQLKTVCSQAQVNGSTTESLWDVLDRDQGIKDIDSTAIVATVNALRTALARNVDNVTWLNAIKRWLFNKSICTLDYLRCELEATYKCEQIWIPGKDGLKIDCMWMQGGQQKAVLLCGGNGFLYECALYMSDSLQSYLQNGFSVMLWNYRGYGRTRGWPTPDNLMKDGLKVAEFLQSVKSVTKLVVHGESMGGMVACFIAARMSIQVLIADRTFSSLEGVAESYGDKARTGMRLLTQWTTDVVSDYINAKCFKVLSSDPHDTVIPEPTSLKNEVANRLVSPIQVLGNARLMMSRDVLKRAALSIVTIRQVSDSKGMSHRMRSLQQIIENLDAAGKFLKCITCDGATPEVLSLWACTMLVWGSYYSKSYSGMSCMDLAEQKLTEAIDTLSSMLVAECPERGMATDLLAFLSGLDAKLTEQMSLFLSDRKPVGAFDPSLAYPSAGFLLPLNCGHNGCLSKEERRYVTHLLKRAGLIQDEEA